MAITQVSNSLVKQDLTISGGTVDNTVIGSGTPAAGTFTTVAGTLASTVTATTAAASDNSTKIATTAYVTTALANLVDSAPGTLNTLNELAAALGDDASFSTTVTNSIATKLPLAGGTMTGNIAHASAFTLDVGGSITLDSDSGVIDFDDGGTNIGRIENASSDFKFESRVQDKDIVLVGNDGGVGVEALRLDMSAAGAATFNSSAVFGGDITANTGGSATTIRLKNSVTGTGGTDGAVLQVDSNEFYIWNFENDDIVFGANNDEKMRIDGPTGNVGIGTSSPGRLLTLFNNDQPVFQITNNTSGTASTRGLIIYQASGSTNTIIDNQGSGSGGSIQFYRAGTLSLGISAAGTIFTAANGVIETASSAGSLTISGGSTNKGGQILLRGGNGDADIIFKAQASTATPAERMRIDSSGNLGIGMTPVTGQGLPLQLQNPDGNNFVGLRFNGQSQAGIWDLYSSYAGGVRMFGIYDRANTRYNLVATQNGNVGIGTETPASWSELHVSAAAGGDQTGADQALYVQAPTATNGHGVGIRLSAASGSREAVGILSMVNNASGNAGSMGFNVYNGGATVPERMRLTNDGYLGIGTTSPGRLLDVGGAGQGAVASIRGGNNNQVNIVHAANGGWGLLLSNSDHTNTGGYHESTSGQNNSVAVVNVNNDALHFGTNNTKQMTISHNGSVSMLGISSGAGNADVRFNTGNGDITYQTSSRLVKEDIEDSPYGLEAVKNLSPKKYKRTDSDDIIEIGFIADEVVEVVPELVGIMKKSVFTKEESDTEDIPGSVFYSQMTAVLVKAIQEQQVLIEALQAEVAALKGE